MVVVLKSPRGKLVPVGPVEVDPNHPLANGLILFKFTGQFDNEQVINLGGPLGNWSVPFATATAGLGQEGPAQTAGAVTYGASSTNNFNLPQTTGTVSIRTTVGWSPTDGANHLPYWIVAAAGGINAQKYFDNNFYIGWNNAGGDRRVVAAASGKFTAGDTFNLTLTYNAATGGGSVLYIKGVQAGTNASLPVPNSVAPGQFTVGNDVANDGAWCTTASDAIYYIAVWNRVLSADEAKLLDADPYGFLIPVEGEMPALQGAAAPAPPFIPNSNDNFNIIQSAQRAAAALLIVTQPFVPFNTAQVAPIVANGWQHTQARTGLPANARAIPTQPTGFAVPANFTPTPGQFGWYQPLSKSAAVAQAKPGSTFVPFNTAQVSIAVVKGWYGQTSTTAVRVSTAQPTQPTSFAVPASAGVLTPGQFGWWANLSKSAPVAQAKPGSTFVPFNTTQVVISPQTVPLNYDAGSVQQRVVYYQSSFQVLRPIAATPNTITGMAWHQPLGVVPRVVRAQPGFTSVPLNTRQTNSITGMGWFQPLSRSAPVAIAQAGFSFVPFNTKQVVTVQVAFDPFVKKKHVSKRRRLEDNLLRQELEIKYKRRLAIEEAFWPPTTYELPPYQLPEHVKPAPDVSDLANVIMQVQQMRAAQAKQQDEEDEKALLELLKREYGIEDV